MARPVEATGGDYVQQHRYIEHNVYYLLYTTLSSAWPKRVPRRFVAIQQQQQHASKKYWYLVSSPQRH